MNCKRLGRTKTDNLFKGGIMKALVTLTVLLILAGCGSAPPPAAVPPPSMELPPDDQLAATVAREDVTFSQRATGAKAVPVSPVSGAVDRAIVSSAELRLETTNADSVHARTIEYAYTHHGYVLLSRSGRTSIRIPAQHFHAALAELETLGSLVEKSIKSDDVTNQFFDLRTRLANAEKTRERYLVLLGRAGTIPEILRMERELERINQLIETYKGKLNRLSHLTLLSTVTVSTKEQVKAGPVGYAFGRVFKGVKWLFVRD
jgi:hypothetical protein